MKTSDFFYDLPDELIAQTPIEPRSNSLLLSLDKNTGEVKHQHFYDIIDKLNQNDVLVINNSRVIPARLYGNRTDTNANIELLLLTQKENDKWETLVKPGKKAKVGAEISFNNGLLIGTITEVLDDGNRIIEFVYDKNQNSNIYPILEKLGEMPLPPYITEKLDDKERYQTIYSKEAGSSAAPTAGLHFTDELMDKIKEKGVMLAEVTLHVGLGTFRPVKVDNINEHHMHSEHYTVSQQASDTINKAISLGGRVICVGTTSCRTIESVASANDGKIIPCSGDTQIFIYPGYKFKVLNGLVTNFHLPESTLIMLVSALCGYENTMNAYKIAVDEKYRFFSFGDAMCIL